MQKVDPPGAGDRELPRGAGGARRPRAPAERSRDLRQPEGPRRQRAKPSKILQDAEAYNRRTVAEATGQASRFGKVYEEYKKAPQVTRQRIYLETMERVFGGTDKIILDSRFLHAGGTTAGRADPALNEMVRRPATGGTQ
jgi:membrane protease subunit HflK